MGVTVGVNGLSVVHKSSGGVSAAFPDVCKTPMPPAGPVPIPYPNIAQSSDTDKGSKNVKIDGNPVCLQDSNFKQSTGNEAGSAGGIASGKTKGKAEFVNYSFDVKIEGKCVPRAFDPMIHNDKNTPPFPLIQPPIVTVPPQESEEEMEDVDLESLEEDEEEGGDSRSGEGSGGANTRGFEKSGEAAKSSGSGEELEDEVSEENDEEQLVEIEFTDEHGNTFSDLVLLESGNKNELKSGKVKIPVEIGEMDLSFGNLAMNYRPNDQTRNA